MEITVIPYGAIINDWLWVEIYPYLQDYLETRNIQIFYEQILQLCESGVICNQ